MTTTASDWVCLLPKRATVTELAFDLDNRGLAYGDGFFTTMSVTDGCIDWAAYHVKRITTHAAALQLDVAIDDLWAEVQQIAQRFDYGVFKLIITRAPQPIRGYGFAPAHSGSAVMAWLKTTVTTPPDTTFINLPNTGRVRVQPVAQAVCLRAQLACVPPPLAGLKSLNCLDNVLASAELQSLKAADPEIAEGLVRDMTGQWVEGTMSNVFYQLPDHTAQDQTNGSKSSTDRLLHGQWYTPPLTQSGVAGVQRQVLIDGLADTGYPVIERALDDADLPRLRALFFCNAVRGIIPIHTLQLATGTVRF